MQKEIKPEELRIGNYIIVDNDLRIENGCAHEVTELRQLDCQVRSIEENVVYGQKYKFINPIPLTEEILLKCGFKKMISQKDCFVLCLDEVFSLDSKDLIYNIKNNCVYINSDAHILDPISTIEFAHQLQNLYFALTQEELVFQLKT